MKIKLSEVLGTIAEELIKANESAEERHRPVMQFEECEVELALAAEQEAKGGINIWAVDLSAGAKRTETNTIRVKFGKIPGQPAVQAPVVDKGVGPEIRRQKRK